MWFDEETCLNSASVKPCNPSCTTSLLLAQPPQLISMEHIEDLLACPPLDRYNFDAERQIIVAAEEKRQHKQQESAEATKQSISQGCNRPKEEHIQNTPSVKLASEARTMEEADAGIHLLREIAGMKFKKAIASIRRENSIDEVNNSINDTATQENKAEPLTLNEGTESGKGNQSKDKWRENYMPLIYPQWTLTGSGGPGLEDRGKLKSSQSKGSSLKNLDTPATNPNYKFKRSISLPSQPSREIETSRREDELAAAVEAGNWTEVRATASLLADISDRETSHSPEDKGSECCNDLVGGGESLRQLFLDETREKVEELLRRAMPDEVDNIHNMMLQFEGREGELIDTLCTMERRMIAQRARAAAHYTTKLEAKARALSSPRSICDVDTSDTHFST